MAEVQRVWLLEMCSLCASSELLGSTWIVHAHHRILSGGIGRALECARRTTNTMIIVPILRRANDQ